jgi:hypothetical protein
MRKVPLWLIAEFFLAAILGIVGVALLLFAILVTLHPIRTAEEQQWYEAKAFVPMIPGLLSASGSYWLFADATRSLRARKQQE